MDPCLNKQSKTEKAPVMGFLWFCGVPYKIANDVSRMRCVL